MNPAVLNGKVVVVTGGASGIGAALCVAAANAGASDVVVADLNLDAAKRVASSLPSTCKGWAFRCNVAVEMDIRRVITATEFDIGPIALFCSNAGIPANGGYDVPNDEWTRIWNVNVMQHVYVARHLFPRWIKRGDGGSMVVTASAAGLLTQVGSLPYSVTKHAAVGLAEWLAITYAEYGIRVSCLCPQAVQTGMIRGSEGGAAGVDGVLSAEKVADDVLRAVQAGTFMIMPHANVKKYFQRKASDYDRWVNGMRRLHESFGKVILESPPISAAKL